MKYQALSSDISLMELQQAYHCQRHFTKMSTIIVKTETCHLHQITEKTFLICHRRIVARQMKILFFVYHTGVRDEERIYIVVSQDTLQFLADSEHWYADGTFRICPKIFCQLYTIHGQRDGRISPCVFSFFVK